MLLASLLVLAGSALGPSILAAPAVLQNPAIPEGPDKTSGAPSTVSPTEEFRTELEALQALKRQRKWKDLRAGLTSLLVRYEGQPCARAQRVVIEDEMKQALFWLSTKEPDPKTLIGGEILVLERVSDAVRLRYGPNKTGRANKLNPIAVRPELATLTTFFGGTEAGAHAPFPDFEQHGSLTLHPLQFNGPYRVELRGTWPSLLEHFPSIVLVIDESQLVVIGLGLHDAQARYVKGETYPVAKLVRMDSKAKKDGEILASFDERPFQPQEKYTIEIQVADDTASLRVNGRLIFSPKKKAKRYGWFGFAAVPGLDSVVLGGKTQGQWIDALFDAAQSSERARFESAWDASKVLPEWLLRTALVEKDSGIAEAEGRVAIAPGALLESWNKLARSGSWEKALALLESPEAADLQDVTRAWLSARASCALGRFPSALEACRKVCAREPKHFEMRRMEVWLGLRIEPPEVARRLARTLVQEFPGRFEACEALTHQLIRTGDFEEAARVVAEGLSRGLSGKEVDALGRHVLRAWKGPTWRSVQRFESKNYEVLSDMDRPTCVEIANVLEESLAHASRVFASPLTAEGRRFRCYVFSGREGYSEYCGDLSGNELRWTAGMFTPILQQLLVWNSPDRESMMNTVRHEGFHQFLDRKNQDVPVWLNEGLAQRYATLHKEKGVLVLGRLSPSARATLVKAKTWPTFPKLFAMDHAGFYARPELHYALAWALVEYLSRESAPEHAAWSVLMLAILKGDEGRGAVAAAFSGVDHAALAQSLRGALESL